jgi:hypothetical protein
MRAKKIVSILTEFGRKRAELTFHSGGRAARWDVSRHERNIKITVNSAPV